MQFKLHALYHAHFGQKFNSACCMHSPQLWRHGDVKIVNLSFVTLQQNNTPTDTLAVSIAVFSPPVLIP